MSTDQIADKVVSLVAAASGCREAFPLSATFLELGLDSLKTMDLVLSLEDAFRVEIPDSLLTRDHLSTPGAVIRMINSLLQSSP